MRITEEEKLVFVETVKTLDPEAKVFLFGSRTDDNKKGGDIDLLVQSNILNENKSYLIRADFFKYMEERKIDLVFTKDFSEIFVKAIYPECIALN